MSQNIPPLPPSLLDFSNATGPSGAASWCARGQNFRVDWHRAGAAPSRFDVASADEIFLLLPDGAATLTDTAGAATPAPGRSVSILPAGAWSVTLDAGASAAALVSLREHEDAPTAANAAAYATRDARIVAVGAPYQALRPGLRVMPIDTVMASKDKPRLKMLQTATMSINWVEYDGPRDRSQLSPHAHAAFEQGSLGLAGDFTHHLRAPWGNDANLWQDDRHATLGSPSLMVVPVGLIHTSEGVGAGRHLLIDVFSPPRDDFIANGWVANAGDYAAPPA